VAQSTHIPTDRKALTAFHINASPAATDSYVELKEALLEALGLSIEQCRRTFWSFTKKLGKTSQEAVRSHGAKV
jgi:hypothetical protein